MPTKKPCLLRRQRQIWPSPAPCLILIDLVSARYVHVCHWEFVDVRYFWGFLSSSSWNLITVSLLHEGWWFLNLPMDTLSISPHSGADADDVQSPAETAPDLPEPSPLSDLDWSCVIVSFWMLLDIVGVSQFIMLKLIFLKYSIAKEGCLFPRTVNGYTEHFTTFRRRCRRSSASGWDSARFARAQPLVGSWLILCHCEFLDVVRYCWGFSVHHVETYFFKILGVVIEILLGAQECPG